MADGGFIRIDEGEEKASLRTPIPTKLPDHIQMKQLPPQSPKSNLSGDQTAKLTSKVRQQAARIVGLEKDNEAISNDLADSRKHVQDLKDLCQQLNQEIEALKQGGNSSTENNNKHEIIELRQENCKLRTRVRILEESLATSSREEDTLNRLTKTNRELINYKASTDSKVLDLMRENESLTKEVAPIKQESKISIKYWRVRS